jgi:acyl-CoA oxidase
MDAFNYPDWLLKAPIGCYDGDVYRKYLDVVKNAPNGLGVPRYWKKYIAPLTATSKL